MKHELSTDLIKETLSAIQYAAEHGNFNVVGLYAHWLNIQKADKILKPEPELKICIEVKGGNVNAVYTTWKDVNVTLIDYDNLNAGEPDLEENNYPITKVEPGWIENHICEVHNSYTLKDE